LVTWGDKGRKKQRLERQVKINRNSSGDPAALADAISRGEKKTTRDLSRERGGRKDAMGTKGFDLKNTRKTVATRVWRAARRFPSNQEKEEA